MADTTDSKKLHVPNPAAWLGRIWDRMPKENNNPALKAWMYAFGLTDKDPRVLEAVACFVDMGERTRKAVMGLRGIPTVIQTNLLSWHEAFDEVIHQSAANGAWSNIRIQFSDVRREQLRHCEMWLNEHMWTAAEEKAEFQSLLEAIEALKSEVLSANVSDDFRELLLDMIEALRRAIAEYEIRGSTGVFSALGEIFALGERYPIDGKRTPEADTLLQKTGALVKRVAAVGSAASGISKIIAVGHQAYDFLSKL